MSFLRVSFLLGLPLCLMACDTGKTDAEGEGAVETNGTGEDTGDQTADDTEDDSDDSGPPPTYSGGTCPELVEGTNTDFLSGGESRRFELVLPGDPVGAGVAFSWHWLGGTGQQTLSWMPYDEQAVSAGNIVVAPDSCCSPYEWLYSEGPEDNADLILFDDIRACLYQQFSIDLDRVWSYGMSAGGLWTSYLTLHRSEELASTAPLSGGANSWSYTTPARQIPVLLTWGGPTDTYGSYSFDTASQYLSEQLRADGSFVVECVHSEGHSIPSGAVDYLWPFLEAHPRGVEPLPYLQGLPDVFPSWCEIP